jgi:hypothetical protein
MRRALVIGLAVTTLLAPSAAFALDRPARLADRPDRAPDFGLPAVNLRIELDRALGEHAFLSIEAMRQGIAGGPEFEVAAKVLEENTVEVVQLIRSTYGEEAADAFAEQWRNHIAYLVDYTRAVADGNANARAVAASQLDTYTADFSAFLVAANPGLPADVVEGLITEHVQQLEQIGNFAEGGFADAYPAIRHTYAHMFMVGDGLGLGILQQFGDRLPGQETAYGPAVDLRIVLDRLLGEHTYLAASAMRARLTDADDLNAAVDALASNSEDLGAAIGEIYGAEARTGFDTLWQRHTTLYLDYVGAVANDDVAAAEQALAGLGQYRSDFSEFLSQANPFLDADQLNALLAAHTNHLVAQVEAYADGEYESAYGALREAYAHTESLAAGLAGAIADQFPQRFPDTALLAGRSSAPTLPIALGLISVLAAWVVSTRGRRSWRGVGFVIDRVQRSRHVN